MSAKSWILVWPLVFTPCQCSYIAQYIVAAGRWSERVDYEIVIEEKEVHWEHEYGSAAIPVHGEPGTGAAWRHRVGSFCGDRQVQIPLSTVIVYFEVSHSEKHSMSFVTSAFELDVLSRLLLHFHKQG